MDPRPHLADPKPGGQETHDAWLTAFAASVPEPLLILDCNAVIVLANASACATFGWTAADLTGRAVAELLPESIRNYHDSVLRKRLAREDAGTGHALELPGLRADGEVLPLEISIGELCLPGSRLFTFLARDISQRKATERRLRESEERHALALRGANDGLWDWDLRTDRIVLSPRWAAMLGLSSDEIAGSPEETWFGRVVPEDLPRLRSDLRAHLESRTGHFQNEHRMHHADGSVRWMLVRGLAVWDADGAPVRFAGSQTDVTEQKLTQQRLRFEVLHDHLTSLPNRAFFLDRLRQNVARSRRRRHPFSLLCVDLDAFKSVNDTLGHPAGDELLVEVSGRLKGALGPHDSAARLGGDEFVVLADGDRTAAVAMAERIQASLSRPMRLMDQDVSVSASIGIACWRPQHVRPEELMKDADTALYHAKARGKACHAVHDVLMTPEGAPAGLVEEELKRALAEGQLRLLYQPVADLRSRRIVGFETLVRWQHPSRGELRAAEFVPAADATSVAEPMAAWIVEHACLQLAHWRRNSGGSPLLSINVSPRQLMNGRCLRELDDALDRSGLRPEALAIEISERMLERNLDEFAAALEPFRERGIGLTLDHFGSGWSSIVALQRLPFTCVKLDPALLAGHETADEAATILRALARLAEDLNLTAVAMGVESAAHLDLVTRLGFPLAQGDYLAPALPEMLAEDLWYGASP